MIFYKADETQANEVKHILSQYEVALSYQINFNKSQVVFSKGIPQDQRNSILIKLDIREVLAHDKCLGLPTNVGRSKKKPFLASKTKSVKGSMDG